MQDRYTGDAGDFGKYGLLRYLCGYRTTDDNPMLSLGVVWYLTPDQAHNADGKHIAYLNQTRRNIREYQSCDPHLYLELSYLVHANLRSVDEVQNANIFDQRTTIYHSEPLDYASLTAERGLAAETRLAYRKHWLAGATAKLANRDLIFLDPDNGLEPSIHQGDPKAHHHAYFDDVRALDPQGTKTVVAYHHLNRSAKAELQVNRKLAQVREVLQRNAWAALYHRGSARAFIIMPSESHQQVLRERIDHMMKSPWSGHFTFHT